MSPSLRSARHRRIMALYCAGLKRQAQIDCAAACVGLGLVLLFIAMLGGAS